MLFTEEKLEGYSKPLSDTEDLMCQNAIRMVADALKKSGFTDEGTVSPLTPGTQAYFLNMKSNQRKIKILVQGSYANNTNVKAQSDVDIAVIQEDIFIPKYRGLNDPFPQSNANYNFADVSEPEKSFKDEAQECLESKFGNSIVRKNKSIKINGNTFRRDTDLVPCRRYRDYRGDYSNDPENCIKGVVIFADDGSKIINYPEQHIQNGRDKNVATHQHFKKMVRIIKKMRCLMEESNDIVYRQAALNVNSFILESLLWNIEDSWFIYYCGNYRKVFAFNQLIKTLINEKGNFKIFKEVNNIKPLCQDDNAFNNLCNFIDQLNKFYQFEQDEEELNKWWKELRNLLSLHVF